MNFNATLAEWIKNNSKPPDCNIHLFIYLNITWSQAKGCDGKYIIYKFSIFQITVMGIILICNFFSFIFWIIIIVNILCLRSSSTVPDLSYLLPILPAQCWFLIRALWPRLRGGRFLVCSPNHSNPLANLDVIASSLSSPDTPLRPRSGRLTGNPW